MDKKFYVICVFVILLIAGCRAQPQEASSTTGMINLPAVTTTGTRTPIAHAQTPSMTTPSASPTTPPPTATINLSIIQHLSPGVNIDVTYVQMLDPQNGWGVGGLKKSGTLNHVFRTADGGFSWMDVTPPEMAPAVTDSVQTSAKGFFPDANTAWVTFHGAAPSQVPQNPVVWKTMDGGRTWTPGAPLDTAGLEVYSVSNVFFSGPSGWVLAHVGAGMNHDYVVLYRSTDGGANWSRMLDPNNDGGIQSCTKTGLNFMSKSDGWLTGNCNGVAPGALLFKTSNGGQDWQAVSLPAPADRSDLFSSMDYACGIRAPVAYAATIYLGVECDKYSNAAPEKISYLYFSSNNGVDWAYYAYPGGNFYTIDGSIGWALANNIQHTVDGGKTWEKINTVPITWNGQLDFLSAQLGYGVAEKDSEYGLIRTTNGGGVWDLLSPVAVAGP